MLDDIRLNIAKLISLYEAEKQRADSLASKLARKEEEVLMYREQITDLNQQIDNLNLMNAFGVASEPALAKDRINKMIREIDKCIKLLEN